MSTYYSIGVNLSGMTVGKYEKVAVSVNRPGVTVRARRGFEERPEETVVSQKALATLQTDLTYAAIPAQIRTAPATPGDKKLYNLPITVSFPTSALTFVPNGEKATARASFYIGAIDDKGHMSDIGRQESTFEIPAAKAGSNELLGYSTQLQTKKGNYRIVVNVRDVATGKMGTARVNVRIE